MSASVSEHYVDLIRHGEPAGGDRLRGAQDDPLSDMGWQQMRSATTPPDPWQAIVSSPLHRCAEFAAELADQHGLPLEIEPNLHEIAFGDWEGRSYRELMDSTPRALRAFFQNPLHNTPPDGEPLAVFASRVYAAWDSITRRHSGRHILIVSHGAVIRAIYCRLLNMPLERLFAIEVPYACRSRIRRHADGDRLVYHAATGHAGMPRQ